MAKKPIAKRAPAKKKAKPRSSASITKAKIAEIAREDERQANLQAEIETTRRAAKVRRNDGITIIGVGLVLLVCLGIGALSNHPQWLRAVQAAAHWTK